MFFSYFKVPRTFVNKSNSTYKIKLFNIYWDLTVCQALPWIPQADLNDFFFIFSVHIVISSKVANIKIYFICLFMYISWGHGWWLFIICPSTWHGMAGGTVHGDGEYKRRSSSKGKDNKFNFHINLKYLWDTNPSKNFHYASRGERLRVKINIWKLSVYR